MQILEEQTEQERRMILYYMGKLSETRLLKGKPYMTNLFINGLKKICNNYEYVIEAIDQFQYGGYMVKDYKQLKKIMKEYGLIR